MQALEIAIRKDGHARLRSRRRPGWALGAMVALLAALVAAPAGFADDTRPTELPYDKPGIPSLDPSYRLASHKVVLITDQALSPRLVTLDEGQLVAWISYSKAPSEIVFEREVARNMICHSLVNFTIKEDELRSAPIHPGEFASFCELKPGRYRYKVIRTDPKAAGATAARARLEGEIIVGNPPASGSK
jgi:hypothetical protein